MGRRIRLISLAFVSVLLVGCGAAHTAINKRNLDVQTKASASIFLDPITNNKKTVFVQVRNTSDKPELDLEDAIRVAMEEKGYTVTQLPDQAYYVLQANILQVGRSDLRAAEHALNQGFGAALGGAVAGAVVGGFTNRHNDKGVIVGGLVGATVATVADAMVQDVSYSVIADIQISERVGDSVEVKAKTRSRLKQGTKSVQEIVSTQKINWNRYQTRVVSTANKVNLKFKLAAPQLVVGLTRAITGVF